MGHDSLFTIETEVMKIVTKTSRLDFIVVMK